MNCQEFENSKEIKNLIKSVISYLEKNPPTVGHGFSHFIKVARHAYEIAEINSSDLSKVAYIAGLLHDLYRPAEGKAGKEEHETTTAKAAKKILEDSAFNNEAPIIIDAINGKDQQIIEGSSSMLAQILSLADKSDMSFQRGVAYTWASNKFLRDAAKPIVYNSFIKVMRDFVYYQVKAWDVLDILDIKGKEIGIMAYLDTDKDLVKHVELEIKGSVNYPKDSVTISKIEAELDYGYVNKYIEKDKNSSIFSNYKDLLVSNF